MYYNLETGCGSPGNVLCNIESETKARPGHESLNPEP